MFAEHLKLLLELLCALTRQSHVRKLRYRQGLVLQRLNSSEVRILHDFIPLVPNCLPDHLILPPHALFDDIVEFWMHDRFDNV